MDAGKNVGSGFRIATTWLLAALVALVMPFGLRAAPAGVPAEVTFTKDIAPLVQRSCENCHRPGGVAPMSLATYEDVNQRWTKIEDSKETDDVLLGHASVLAEQPEFATVNNMRRLVALTETRLKIPLLEDEEGTPQDDVNDPDDSRETDVGQGDEGSNIADRVVGRRGRRQKEGGGWIR